MKNKKSFTLRLSEDHLKTLKGIAEREDRTVSAIIRKLINDEKERIKIKSA